MIARAEINNNNAYSIHIHQSEAKSGNNGTIVLKNFTETYLYQWRMNLDLVILFSIDDTNIPQSNTSAASKGSTELYKRNVNMKLISNRRTEIEHERERGREPEES